MGINVNKNRYLYTMFGGAFSGLGGAALSLCFTPSWNDGMTGGMGWIAIALVIFSTWNPAKVAIGTLVFGGITSTLKKGDAARFVGFGTFTVRERAARMGRNPRTGGALKIAPSKVPALRAGKKLRDTVKRSTDDPGPSDFAKSER